MTAVLAAQGVTLERRGRSILIGVDLTIVPGEVLAITGTSGAGKSTLLRLIAGLEPLTAGTIRIGPLTLAPRQRRIPAGWHAQVGLVFQTHCLFEHLTALDNVRLALRHVRRISTQAATDRARTLLEELGVGHRAGAWPRELSGGEAQRVAIARALALDPAVLLLDEPTASLDAGRRGEVGRLFQRLAAEGRALLVASHDEEFVATYASRVAVLENGQLRSTSPPVRR